MLFLYLYYAFNDSIKMVQKWNICTILCLQSYVNFIPNLWLKFVLGHTEGIQLARFLTKCFIILLKLKKKCISVLKIATVRTRLIQFMIDLYAATNQLSSLFKRVNQKPEILELRARLWNNFNCTVENWSIYLLELLYFL